MAIIHSAENPSLTLRIGLNNFAAAVDLKDTNGNSIVAESQQNAPNGSNDGRLGIVSMGVNDGIAKAIRTDRLGSTALASFVPVVMDSFEGTVLHPVRWTITATTMAATVSSANGITFNSGNITTINTGYSVLSAKKAMKSLRAPIHGKFRARVNSTTNSVIQLGFGDATTFNGANTTGAYWEKGATGALVPVLVFNSNVLTGVDVSGLLEVTNYYTFDVILDDDSVTYIIQDASSDIIISRQVIKLPVTAQRLLSTTQISGLARLYITGTAPSTAPQLGLSDFNILLLDINQTKAWGDVSASLNRSIIENPFTGAQLPAWTNSAEPASAVLSNTAAGYGTLGGKFQFAAVAGAVTDFALFGFQVPAPSNFVITGVTIDAWVTGAAIATTPTLLTWALGVGSTAVSLATATVQRVGLGAQTLPVGAAIGTCAVTLVKSFNTPHYCSSGRFIHVILRIPVGTATASQIIAGMVNFQGYTE
jgi:hypothetical protein